MSLNRALLFPNINMNINNLTPDEWFLLLRSLLKETCDDNFERVWFTRRHIGELIQKLDPTETEFHVEYNQDSSSDPKQAEVMRAVAWKQSYERKRKLYAIRERTWQARDELIAARKLMAQNLLLDPVIGPLIEEEQAESLVSVIVAKKQYDKAAKFGCGNLKQLLEDANRITV